MKKALPHKAGLFVAGFAPLVEIRPVRSRLKAYVVGLPVALLLELTAAHRQLSPGSNRHTFVRYKQHLYKIAVIHETISNDLSIVPP